MTADSPAPLDQAIDWLLRIREHPEDAYLREQLACWLAADDQHRIAYRKAERALEASAMLPAIGQPVAATRSATPRSARPRQSRARRRLKSAGAIAACCLVALVYQPVSLGWQADYRTGEGERRVLQLSDGSLVTLDAQSAVAVDIDATRRHVSLLQGQAFFTVSKDAGRPFEVDAGELTVRVTGTEFNVDRRHAQVNVTEGSVQVAGVGGPYRQLRPGQGLRLARNGSFEPADTPATQVATWREGRLIVRARPIAEVLDRLAPYLGSRLVIRDASLTSQTITGVYDLDDPQAALRAVLSPYGGRAKRIGPLTLIDRSEADRN